MINIHASGRMADILGALPGPVVLSEVVRSRELLSIQSLDALNPEGGSFQSIISGGIVNILDFESEDPARRSVQDPGAWQIRAAQHASAPRVVAPRDE
jgi:hypothetical protein